MKRAWINVAVGVGCAGLIVALILPAIQQSREASRRSVCKMFLKTFAVAMENYHDIYKKLPPAHWTSSGWGWRSMLIPYVEAVPVKTISLTRDGRLRDWSDSPRRRDFVSGRRWGDLCPSDDLASRLEPSWPATLKKTAIRSSINGPQTLIGASNYIAIFGDEDLMCSAQGTGLFWPNSGVSLKDDVRDGTSTTLMLGERDGSIHLAGNWAGTSYDENDPDACLDPQFVVDALVDSRPINGRDERCFSSRHGGGAHFLFADGAVKFISEKCSTTILRRLANRSDGIKVLETDIPTTP